MKCKSGFMLDDRDPNNKKCLHCGTEFINCLECGIVNGQKKCLKCDENIASFDSLG